MPHPQKKTKKQIRAILDSASVHCTVRCIDGGTSSRQRTKIQAQNTSIHTCEQQRRLINAIFWFAVCENVRTKVKCSCRENDDNSAKSW